MEHNLDLTQLLDYIDPSALDYQEWANVGMALKEEGYACVVWEDWSRRDRARYHEGECEKKWRTFGNYSGARVTGGTIYQMAKENGWLPHTEDRELDWDDQIGGGHYYGVGDKADIEDREDSGPEHFEHVREITNNI